MMRRIRRRMPMKFKGEALLRKSYHIPLPLFDQAFRCFQKKYVYPRNILLTGILSVIFIVYFISMLKEPQNELVYLLLVVCLAMILIIWYNPMKLRRSLMASLKELESDTYHFTLYADGVEIGTEDAPLPEENPDAPTSPEPEKDTEDAALSADEDGFLPIFEEENADPVRSPVPVTGIPFGAGLKIHEFDEFFMLYLVKQNFYVVPKKDFTDAELNVLRDTFPIE